MNALRIMLAALMLGLVLPAFAQTFDLEQFEQMFRPRLRLDARLVNDAAFRDTTGRFGIQEGTAVVTFPLRSHFKAGFKLDTAARGLKGLLKNSIRVEASQMMGSLRFGARELQLGFDSIPIRRLCTASAGLLGIRLTRRYRVMFWSANINFSEEDRTVHTLVPRFNGVIGRMRIKGLRKQSVMGLAFAYSDGLLLPVPFIGGAAPLGGRWSVSCVLPVQASLGFHPGAGTRFSFGITADGFRTGMEWNNERVNMNLVQWRAFLSMRHRVNRTIVLRADAGRSLRQSLGFPEAGTSIDRFPVDDAFTASIGINILFGGSVMQRLLDDVPK